MIAIAIVCISVEAQEMTAEDWSRKGEDELLNFMREQWPEFYEEHRTTVPWAEAEVFWRGCIATTPEQSEATVSRACLWALARTRAGYDLMT